VPSTATAAIAVSAAPGYADDGAEVTDRDGARVLAPSLSAAVKASRAA
jgi:hypothetical protein